MRYLLLLFLMTPLYAEPPEERISDHLQNISVTLRAGKSEGSGIIFTRGELNFIWTAAHVIQNVRRVRQQLDPESGEYKDLISYKDVYVIRDIKEGENKVGEVRLRARVIKYSQAQDLAILLLYKRNYFKETVIFNDPKDKLLLGTDLYHVGSLLGQIGSNSMTKGILSQKGRMIGPFEYDQTTVTAFPGSSGGGVYLKNGKCVGMVVRGAGETFNLIVPLRRMFRWAKKAKVLWAFDRTTPLPLQINPKIDDPITYKSDELKNYPTLIKEIK